MQDLRTPGLYRQPVMPVRAAGRLSRGDVPVFLGYARRGPVGLPVRIENLTAFEEVFGRPLEAGHLHPALKGFFETGGRTAYVLRVAQAHARVAAGDLPGGVWRAEASFPWTLLDPRERRREARPEEANWVQLIEDIFRTTGPRSPAPGAWANGYTVTIRAAERVRTETVPGTRDDPRALALRSLAGLEAASVLTLTQTRDTMRTNGAPVRASFSASVIPAGVDAVRQQVTLATRIDALPGAVAGQDGLPPDQRIAPAPFDLDAPIQVVSVEFDVEIHSDGRLEQAFRALSPNPDHTAAITSVVTRAARSLALDAGTAPRDWADPANWPPEGTFQLTGGTDGLEGIGRAAYLGTPGVAEGGILSQLRRLDDVALIAAPDLVLQTGSLPPADELPPEPVDCHDLSPPEPGRLRARVVEVDLDGVERPLRRVTVDVTGPGGRAETDAQGVFTVTGVAPGLVTIRLTKEGFEPAEALVQSSRFLPADPVTLTMARVTLPRALSEDEVLEVLQALANPALVGPYKVVIADPPKPDATLDDLRTWRARLGNSDRMGFFAPWLRLPPPDTGGDLVPCPPCGHVCGAFAAGEIALGIHRTGANLPLRFVQGVTRAIDDAEQGILNPAGINAIRAFPGRGTRAFGTRTLSADPEWRYLTARRVVDAIEKTLERALHWMVFEPNNLMTRHAVAQTAATLLDRLFRSGILAGSTAAEAYAVKCDLENNPDESRAAGTLVVDIGVAPTTPLEFVLFRLGSAYDALTVTETAR